MTFIGKYKLIFFDEIDSTNSEAIRFAKKDKPNMEYVILAKTQTKARGRSGKNWQSSGGNLHASLLIKPSKELELLPQLSFITGLAVYNTLSSLLHETYVITAEAGIQQLNDRCVNQKPSLRATERSAAIRKNNKISTASSIFNWIASSKLNVFPRNDGITISTQRCLARTTFNTVKLKWPNDVLVNGKKIAGILLESVKVEDEYYLIIGIGINITSHPTNIDQPTTSLINENLPSISPQALLEILINNFEKYYSIWGKSGFAPIRKTWLEHAYKLHENITVKHQDNILTGIFKDIDPSGRIILQLPSKKIISFSTAELSF